MKKLIKWPLRLLCLLLALIVVGVLIVAYQANSLVKRGVEQGGTYALGVPTTLGDASVGIFSGELGLKSLSVGSPQGYSEPHFLTLGTGEVAVSLASLREDVINVPRFALDNIDVRLEKKDGKANYAVIMDNVKKVTGGGGSEPAPPSPDEKRLIIDDLSITNVTIHAQVLEGVAPAKVTVPIKEIRLKNVGRTGTGVAGSGVTVSQLAAIIVEVLMAAAVENGAGILPAELLGDLKGMLDVEKLKKFGVEAIEGLQADVKKQLDATVDEAKKKLEEEKNKVIEGINKGIGDLIPGKK